VLVDPDDGREEPARCEHLVPDPEVVDHRLLVHLAAPLGAHDHQPDQEKDEEHEDENRLAAHSSPSSRSRICTVKSASVPLSTAERASSVTSRRNRMLWRLSSRRPRSSFWLTRWRM